MTVKILEERVVFTDKNLCKLYKISGVIKGKLFVGEIFAPSRNWARRSGAPQKLMKAYLKDNKVEAIFWPYQDYPILQKIEFIKQADFLD